MSGFYFYSGRFNDRFNDRFDRRGAAVPAQAGMRRCAFHLYFGVTKCIDCLSVYSNLYEVAVF